MNLMVRKTYEQRGGQGFTSGPQHVRHAVGYGLEYRFKNREQWSRRGHLEHCCICQGLIETGIKLGSGGDQSLSFMTLL